MNPVTAISIDFGAAATKTACRLPSGSVDLVRVGSAREFPTAVYLSSTGQIDVGDRAIAYRGRRGSDRLLHRIKHQINEPGEVARDRLIRLGGREMRLVEVVAAIFGRALEAAEAVVDCGTVDVTLTHPDSWNEPEQAVLAEALSLAGVNTAPSFVSEPEAAAGFAVELQLASFRDGAVAVFDLGASTFDAAVVAAGDNGATVRLTLPTSRIAGGDDFDAHLLEHIENGLTSTEADVFRQLRTDRAWALALEARRLKEALSADEWATFAFGGLRDVKVYRDQLVELVAPMIDECVSAFEACLDSLPPATTVGTIVGSGGSVQMPYVRDRLEQLAQQRNTRFILAASEDVGPGQVIAPGALHLIARREREKMLARQREKIATKERKKRERVRHEREETEEKLVRRKARSERFEQHIAATSATPAAKTALRKHLPPDEDLVTILTFKPQGSMAWDSYGLLALTTNHAVWAGGNGGSVGFLMRSEIDRVEHKKAGVFTDGRVVIHLKRGGSRRFDYLSDSEVEAVLKWFRG